MWGRTLPRRTAQEEGDAASRRGTRTSVAHRHRVGSGGAGRNVAGAGRAGARLHRVAAGVKADRPREVLEPGGEGLRGACVRQKGVEAAEERNACEVDAAFEEVVLRHGRARPQAAYPTAARNGGKGVDGQGQERRRSDLLVVRGREAARVANRAVSRLRTGFRDAVPLPD